MRLPLPGPREVLGVLERGADSVEQLLAAVPRLVSLLGEAEQLLGRVDRLIDDIDRTRASADDVVRRTNAVVDLVEPSLVTLQPTLERLAETTHPQEVDALVTLVDHLPALAARMETEIIPVLDSLSTVAPDLHDLLDVSRELNEMLAKVPGLGRMKKRIDEQQAENGRG
ncbi:MAG: hypothetical protein ACRDXB_11135 [Actinomycetes bacterium]